LPRLTPAHRRALACFGIAASSVTVPLIISPATGAQSGATVLRTDDASLGGWTVNGAGVTRTNGIIRMRDRASGAAAATVVASFAPRSSVVVSAETRRARQFWAHGRARAVMQVGSDGGQRIEAGVLRARDGSLRWAAWSIGADGSRGRVAVSSARVKMRSWTRAVLVTHWNRARGGGALRVNGRVVVRSPRLDLTAATATRASVGLGATTNRGDVGVLHVRRAMTWGAEVAQAISPQTPQPAAGTPAAPTAPVSPAPGAIATPPAAVAPRPPTAPAAPRTPTTPRPAPGPSSPPPPAGTIPGTVFSRVDFESGSYNSRFGPVANFGGISSFQATAVDRISSVPSPPGGSGRVARFELQDGDVPVSCCGERTEVSIDTNDTEGQERWYTWATMFDQSFVFGQRSSDFQVVTQFHSQHDGQPPVAFYAEGGDYRLQVWPKNANGSSAGPAVTIWSTRIATGRWYRIALHVKWSGSDDTGFVELFVDGQPAGQKTLIRTLYPGYTNYTKLGLYRDPDITGTSVVYHDDFQASSVP
jgi:Polysaccharide lyase